MAGKFKYCKFFRFRSPVDRGLKLGDQGGAFWLIESAKYIDLSKEMLYLESIALGMKTQGALTVEYLMKLPYNDYEFIRKEVEIKIKNG
jgi:hypothetical protein